MEMSQPAQKETIPLHGVLRKACLLSVTVTGTHSHSHLIPTTVSIRYCQQPHPKQVKNVVLNRIKCVSICFDQKSCLYIVVKCCCPSGHSVKHLIFKSCHLRLQCDLLIWLCHVKLIFISNAIHISEQEAVLIRNGIVKNLNAAALSVRTGLEVRMSA